MAHLPQERIILPSPKLDADVRVRYLEQRLAELQRAISLIFVGKGDPLGVVDANKGSIFLRVDGTADTAFYTNTTDGRTGWLPMHPVLHGTGVIADAATTVQVTMVQAMPDTSYQIIANVGATTGNPPPGANRISSIVINSVTQFTITIETAPGTGNTITYNYIAIR